MTDIPSYNLGVLTLGVSLSLPLASKAMLFSFVESISYGVYFIIYINVMCYPIRISATQ